MNLRGKRAVITGASSGIGAATALLLASEGVELVIAGRRLEQLQSVAEKARTHGVRCEPVRTDVRVEADCQALIGHAIGKLGGVDILVNNAGFGVFGPVRAMRTEDLQGMMDTNYFGMLHCTRAVLPSMIEQRSGSIVNVSSIAGIMGYAGMSGYSATKFAVAGFTEGLRDEVRRYGVSVSLVCPGGTTTEFFDKANRNEIPAASRLVPDLTPERVARAIRRSIRTGRYRVILPWPALVYMRLKELFPRTAHAVMRVVSRALEHDA